jgi:hypothetical protein
VSLCFGVHCCGMESRLHMLGRWKQRQHVCTGNQGDLVFATFKEQQQQYQALLDGSKVRCGAHRHVCAPHGSSVTSRVGATLSTACIGTHERSTESVMLRPLQNIKAPLNGDEAAIKKYAQEMEALRQKVRPWPSAFLRDESLHVGFASPAYTY